MPRSRELRGVVVPDVDNNALRRNVTGPLNRALDSVSSITPSVDTGGLGGMGSGRGGRSGLGGQTVQVAQLDVLEDIHETLRGQDGGGGGLLTGLGVGRLLGGGGGAALGGLLGGGALIGGGALGLGAVIQDQFGEVGLGELFKQQLSPEMSIANAFTGGLAGAGMGLGNLLLEQSGDIGEALGLVDDAEAFEERLLNGLRNADEFWNESVRKASLFWTEDVPQAITSLQLPPSIRNFQWPDFSGIQIPKPIRDLTALFGGGDGGQTGVSPTAEDMGLAPSDQRLVNMQSRRSRPQQSRPQANIDLSPNIDIGVDLDPAGLEDLKRQLRRDLRNDDGLIDEIVDLATRQVEAKITGIGRF